MDITEWIVAYNEEALTADGFDAAIIGMCERFGNTPVVAYDRDKCIEILVEQFAEDHEDYEDPDMNLREEAEEYFGHNVIGAYVGENTPVYIVFHPKFLRNYIVFHPKDVG